MTTIASDGKTVAADGQETWGGDAVRLDHRKIKAFNGLIYAFSGTGGMLDVCIEWHQAGAIAKDAPEAKGDNSWGLCIFHADHVDYYSNTVPYPSRYPYPFSFGSGSDYAMGALLAGASPRRAIEIAIERNIYTGGEITVMDVGVTTLQVAAE